MLALGLMSGTSMDGIDAALLTTDGEFSLAMGASLAQPYDPEFRARLRCALGGGADGDTARELTRRHAVAVKELLARAGLSGGDVDVIGFHGHTTEHAPAAGVSRQIGDGAHLARETGIEVVNDFRQADIAGGGEGAPLAPLYHAALAQDLERPIAIINLGGVANVTWIGDGGDIAACDTGPGNAMIDDWVAARFPSPPRRWLVTGGGRHNPVLMKGLARALGVPVRPVESEGWDGDMLEAQAFAYLAVRSLRRLPLSLPATTGVSRPLTGGRLHRP